MKKKVFLPFLLLILIMIMDPVVSVDGQSKTSEVTKENVLAAIRKASDYMVNEVSNRGGYLHKYAEDFSEISGEVPARESQVWVQSATPQYGELYLDLYKLTGDETYLDYAKKTAAVLIYGQHELGGWHYFIDFEPRGLEEWYETVASQFFRGLEEFRYYYGNCTFDDNVTQGATAFLLHLYMETLDPVYMGPLKKALDFILISQYPNGGWPQRYPLRYDYAHDGFDDYTSNYTLNDDAMNNTINVLIEAYELLGDEKYLEAARRGGDFLIIAQGPEELPAWSEQYDMRIQPDWARTHEPPAYGTRQTAHTLEILMKLFLFTGDRRYLRPVPATLKWMEESKLKVLDKGVYEMARYYDPDTNLPIDFDVLDERSPDGYVVFHYFASDEKPFTGRKQNVDFEELKTTYEFISNLPPEKVREVYHDFYKKPDSPSNPDKAEILRILNARNENGIWIEEMTVFDVEITMVSDDNKKQIRGIDTKTVRRNIRKLMNYIEYQE